MMKKILFIGLAAFCGLFSAQSAYACVSVEVLGAGPVNYSPTDDLPTIQKLQVSVRNICEDGSQPPVIPARLYFADDTETPPYSQIGGVPVSLRFAGQDLLRTPVNESARKLDMTVSRTPQIYEIDMALAPRSKAVDSVRPITLVLEYADNNGQIQEVRQSVLLGVNALPAVSITLADGLSAGAIDLGDLTANDRGSVQLRIFSSAPYQIKMASEYDSKLRRAENCGVPMPPTNDQRDFVEYRTELNGRNITEAAPFQASAPTAVFGIADPIDLPFSVIIDSQFSPENTRAGKYCDVITLAVTTEF